MSGLKIITGPAITPVSKIEALEYLRLDEGIDDMQVRSYIQASTTWAENYTNRFFISRTCQMMLDGAREVDSPLWEGMRTGPYRVDVSDHIELAAAPVLSVESVKYYSDNDTQSTWAASNYYVDTFSEPAKISLRSGGSYPTDLRNLNGLEINFTAGYGTNPFTVPEPIRVAILQYLTFLYENRGDDEVKANPPQIVKSLLDPYRVLRFSTSVYDKNIRSGVI